MLFFVIMFYNSHRYLLKIGSSDFTDGTDKGNYIPTPFLWQIGKYILISIILFFIYILSSYEKKIHRQILYFYLAITIFVIIVLLSGSIYGGVINNSIGEFRYQLFAFDELEIAVWAFLLFPMSLIKSEILINSIKTNINKLLNILTIYVILSNLYVITNYYFFDVLPFHAFEGTFLIRFGGLWDDPNTFSILNVFLLLISLLNKNIFLSFCLLINIVFAISFTGYLLLFFVAIYIMIRSKYYLYLGLGCFFILGIITYLNIDFIYQIIELKQGSLDAHGNTMFDFFVIPFLQPIIFHESWFISFLINYPPFSFLILPVFFYSFILIYFKGKSNVQNLYFILFFITSWFLPFLYLFPLNIILFILFILSRKKIIF